MIIILTLLGFLFGAAAYFAENESNGDAFDSILKVTYWGIITITSVGYGDITPITPTGRVISCLCPLFGSGTIGMLVSVLVDRYQCVYAQKLYTDDPEIDFDNYSNEENKDASSNDLSYSNAHHDHSTTADPDTRAKQNGEFQNDLTELPETSESQLEEEESIERSSSRTRFIISYADDEKQTLGGNISLNIIANKQQQRSSSLNVKFELTSSSDDDHDDLTEFNNNDRRKWNVLKTFQRSLSLNDVRLNNAEKNV